MKLEIDEARILVGKPKRGKTSLVKELVLDHIRKGAMVFVQDPRKQFAGIMPWYPTIAHYVQALRKAEDSAERGQAAMIEGSVAIGDRDSEPLSDFVLALSKRLKTAEGKGPKYLAICYDEVSNITGVSRSYIPPKMTTVVTERRHIGIALIISGQHLGMFHVDLRECQTHLHMFRTSKEKRIRQAAEETGVDFDELKTALKNLPLQFRFVTIHEEEIV